MRYGEYIGTIRYLPMNQDVAPCEALVRRHGIAGDLLENGWEVGRLVLASRWRSSPEALKRFLLLTLVDLLQHQAADNLFASCTPVLSRLYRRFGFTVLVREASREADGSYSLIHGFVPAVLQALAASPEERQLAGEALALRPASRGLPC